ncbi:MAG: antibiotic ABC transporter ATP-binding protein [Flavobacteriales bacterium]|nr:MAG: antibiotic ABC transporter ATP-binding protein [Flavobacteriales bacterium]
MATVTGKALDLPILKRILGYVRPYKSTFWLTAFLTILSAFLTPARPWIVQYTLDNSIIIPNNKLLLIMTSIMIGVLILEAIVQFCHTYLANWLGQSVIRDIRVQLYRHIVAFKLKYFDKTAIGTLVTRVVSDIETIADIFSQGILTIIGDILQLIVVVAVMFWIDWRLALLSLSSIPLLIVATYIFKNAVKSAFQDVRTQVARLNAFVQEHITGMNIVQIFNREEKEYEKFKQINVAHRDAHIRSVWAYSIFFPIVEILSALSLALVIWWGAKGVITDKVTFGNLVAFILYIYMLFRPIRQLADRFNVLQMGMVAGERIFKVLDTKFLIEDNGIIKGKEIKGNIEFKKVWFTYNKEEWVLRDVSFKANKGETLAIVGATGAGKTSIINILSRFYEFQKGEILIDGNDIRQYEIDGLRKNVAVVLQDVFLFSDSILNNITINNSEISREQVKKAAEIVGADKFIEKLPGSYDYNVMERGAMLSVGQRQLLAFIRAYVYNPKILILDEATSSVDTETEELIQYAIGKLTENRTSIVIAHRLSTIQNADKILVLAHGELIEEGSHQQLLAQNGHYKKLYELQFVG